MLIYAFSILLALGAAAAAWHIGRRQANEALAECRQVMQRQEKLLDQVGRMARIGGWELDVATQIPTWTEEVYRIHELDPELWPNLADAISYYAPEARPAISEAVEEGIRSGKAWDLQLPLITARGRRRWVRAMGEAESENGQVVRLAGTFQDITVQKLAEAQLRIAKEAAESAARAKGEFLANMSHEIRTPLNGVLGFTDLLLQQPLNTTERDYAQTIRSSAHSLLTVVNDILDFSKIEAGKLELESLDFDPRVLLVETAKMVAVQAHSRGLEVIVDVLPSVPMRVRGDPDRVRQILGNLCSNAVKFTERGEIHVQMQQEESTDTHLLLNCSVRDTGIGMTPAVLDSLFQPFRQGDASTTRRYGGTGLGLSIARQLAQAMGGTIEVRSVPEMGSTFRFTMRLERASQSPDAQPGLPPESCLLMVVPNATQRQVLERELDASGLRVQSLASLDALLACLRSAAPAESARLLLLADLPDAVAAQPETCPQLLELAALAADRLVLTCRIHTAPALARFCKGAGIRMLVKPFSPLELLGLLAMQQDGAAAPVLPEPRAVQVAQHQAGRLRVLLAEDNLVNQKLVLAVLKRLNCDAVLAKDGFQAVDLALSERFDLILMDCQMPEMDGYQATREIRAQERDRRTPIIALTANAMRGDREKCLAAGMDDYFAKPLDVLRLSGLLDGLRTGVQLFDAPAREDAAEQAGTSDPEPVDLQAFRQLTEGDAAFEREIVATFIDSGDRTLSAIVAAMQCRDLDRVRQEAHALKGASANIHADTLKHRAAALESAAANGASAELETLLQSARTEFQHAARFLTKVLQRA